MRKSECGIKNGECGRRNAECARMNAECGRMNAEWKMTSGEGGVKNEGRGIQNEVCTVPAAGEVFSQQDVTTSVHQPSQSISNKSLEEKRTQRRTDA